ncbi:MAG: hypothetical protein WCL50_09180, partial [Spirochaetota bacterium]
MRLFKHGIPSPRAATLALLYAATMIAVHGQASGAAGADTQVSIAGTIGAQSGATVFVTTAEGQAKVIQIKPDTFITGRRLATLASIRPGEAMGVAATRGGDGTLTATAINVFPPELWQRVRKGQFPMANGQVMTNAQVESLGAGVRGQQILLKFEMLTAAIDVPEGADIRRTVTLGLADLRAGMKVTIRGTVGTD